MAETSLEASLETASGDSPGASDSAGVTGGGDLELADAGGAEGAVGGVLGRLKSSEATTEGGTDFLSETLLVRQGVDNSQGANLFGLPDLLSFTLAAGLAEESDLTAFNCGDLELVRPDFLSGGDGEAEAEGDLIALFLEGPVISGVSGMLACWVNPDISTEVKVREEAVDWVVLGEG